MSVRIVERGGKRFAVVGRAVSDAALEPGAVAMVGAKEYTSAVVVLRVPDDVAAKLALDPEVYGRSEGGEAGALPPGDLHLTLAYLGDAGEIDEGSRARLVRALRGFAGTRPPVAGRFGGRIAFDLPDGRTAFCAHFDAPGLQEFRADLVAAVEAWGGPKVAGDHGFTPHITLAYLPPGELVPEVALPEGSVTLGALELWRPGGRTPFELAGEAAKAYSRKRCMRCKALPEVDVRWADGRGRAWFCAKCYEEWKKEMGDPEIVAERQVKGGQVPEKWSDYKDFDPSDIGEGAKPWTVEDPPPPATNWTAVEKERCVAAANAVLAAGGDDREAVFACIRAAGKTKDPGGEGAKEGDMPTQEITVLVETDELEDDAAKAWDGSPSRWADTEAYCEACLLDLNAAAGRETKAQSHCMLPVVEPGGSAPDWEAVQAAAGGHGITQVKRPPDVSAEDWDAAVGKAARKIAAEYRENDREPPASVAKLTGQKGADEKAGRRVNRDKVGIIERVASELRDLVGAVGDLLSWARYEDGDDVGDLMTIAELMDSKGAKSLADLPAAFAFKGADGRPWWFQWTTNAFVDREGEIFTTDAIEALVERHEKELAAGERDKIGEFWFWHIPGTKFADVRWEAVVGRFLAQAGPFDDAPVGRKFREFFAKHPLHHDVIAPQGWGSSHGYYYKARDREDGVYESFEIKESTVLPAQFASNPWNPLPRILEVEDDMNDKQRKALAAIGGDEFVRQVEEAGRKTTEGLEALVAFKGNADPEDEKGGKWSKAIRAALEGITDEKMRDRVNAFLGRLEQEMPKQPSDDEGEKAKPTCQKMGEELRLIAGQVGGDAGKALKAVADEMVEYAGGEKDADVAQESQAEAVSVETEAEPTGEPQAQADPEPTPEGEKEGDAEPAAPETTTAPEVPQADAEPTDPTEEPLTRAEVADGMKALIDLVDERIGESGKAIAEIVEAAVKEAVAPLADRLAALEKDDGEKIAEKAALTPAASLTDLVMAARSSKATRVPPTSPLAQGPPEAEPEERKGGAGRTGLFFDAFIEGNDQAKE